ncbi:protein of unknown function [Methylocella tundrae]|uniref:Uncharacterized protein n=1 Tax=Methylocella tundrae TaxID=227605 RepID=A0A4U8Z4R1_METTU|nr:protein of unknown function [Methylocella tundrae]
MKRREQAMAATDDGGELHIAMDMRLKRARDCGLRFAHVELAMRRMSTRSDRGRDRHLTCCKASGHAHRGGAAT